MKASAQHIETIGRALQYIETYLTEPIRIEQISQQVGYSLCHFSRVFNAVTYISPYTYLMRRRISEAALQVVQTRRRLTDIAVDFGFQSSEVFARSFRRIFAATPSELRKQKCLDTRLLLPALNHQQLNAWQNFHTFSLQKEQLQSFTLYGIMTHCNGSFKAVQKTWQTVEEHFILPPTTKQIGLRFFPPQWEKNGIFYFSGYEIAGTIPNIPAWFVQKTITSQPALITTRAVTAIEVDDCLQYLHCAWFPISSYRADVPYVIEQYHDDSTTLQMILPARLKPDR